MKYLTVSILISFPLFFGCKTQKPSPGGVNTSRSNIKNGIEVEEKKKEETEKKEEKK